MKSDNEDTYVKEIKDIFQKYRQNCLDVLKEKSYLLEYINRIFPKMKSYQIGTKLWLINNNLI